MLNIIDKAVFQGLTQKLVDFGYEDEILWSRNIKPCDTAFKFASEATWVILNSGMKNQIAQKIWDKIKVAWCEGRTTASAFGHKGKVSAIDYIWTNRDELFTQYQSSDDKIGFLKSLPWIGGITCWHLAKNLGHDCVKPDRWLVRVADKHNTTPDNLCEQISQLTGETKHTVDLIIWRACNLNIIVC